MHENVHNLRYNPTEKADIFVPFHPYHKMLTETHKHHKWCVQQINQVREKEKIMAGMNFAVSKYAHIYLTKRGCSVEWTAYVLLNIHARWVCFECSILRRFKRV